MRPKKRRHAKEDEALFSSLLRVARFVIMVCAIILTEAAVLYFVTVSKGL